MFTAGWHDDLKDLYDNHRTKPVACFVFDLKEHFGFRVLRLAPVYFTSCFCLASVVLMPFHFTSI